MSGRGMLAAAAVLVSTLGLAGCGSAPTPTPSPRISSRALPDQNLTLAAVESRYTKYLQVGDQVSADGGTGVNRLDPYLTDKMLESEAGGLKVLNEKGWRTSGESAFNALSIESMTFDTDGKLEVRAYVCLDVSQVRVLDSQGNDVTPSTREDRLPLSLGWRGDSVRNLELESSEVWQGNNFCS